MFIVPSVDLEAGSKLKTLSRSASDAGRKGEEAVVLWLLGLLELLTGGEGDGCRLSLGKEPLVLILKEKERNHASHGISYHFEG